VLGTGLSGLVATRISERDRIAYRELGLPQTSLAGHAGEAIAGTWHHKRVLVFAGRLHLYQGFDADTVTAPVCLARAAGARTLVLTNAAGGLNPDFHAGELVLIADQVNLTGTSPLGRSADPNPFVEMLDAYDPALRALARRSAAGLRIALREGVYAGVRGPAFETPAEARWLRSIADVVGMSTVLETIRARALGMRVLGFSAVTNMVGEPTSHEAVVATSDRCAPVLARLLDAIVAET
jgi:purine-nucleoside phosphorylase